MTDEQRPPEPKPVRPRPRLRIGIGGLMLLILGFGAWLGDRVNRARDQRLAVVALKSVGGFVRYADEFGPGPVQVAAGDSMWKPAWGTLAPGRGTWAPDWLRDRLGDEYFREVAHVSTFVDIQKGSAHAPGLGKPPIDDALAAIRGQSGVRTLQLGGATVTDRGLAAVADLTNLEEFFLWWGTGITDAGVAHLARLPRLRLVDIGLASVTDESLVHLAELPALANLSLQGRKFSDRGLEGLRKAWRLESLLLRMGESGITDAGLRHLEGLSNLKHLALENTTISREARERLRKALPALQISP